MIIGEDQTFIVENDARTTVPASSVYGLDRNNTRRVTLIDLLVW